MHRCPQRCSSRYHPIENFRKWLAGTSGRGLKTGWLAGNYRFIFLKFLVAERVTLFEIISRIMKVMQTEYQTVTTFLHLMSPLLPSGRLAVVISGTPRRSKHRAFCYELIEQAARFRTHRRQGISILEVHFGPGVTQCNHGSLLMCIDIDEESKKIRVNRMTLLLIGCVVLFLVFRLSGNNSS